MAENATSRSEYVMRNTTVTLAMQLVKILLGFISRTVFIKILGSEYLGVNSLFTEILTMLSFAELGIGNAMIFSLYKPLAENDNEKVKSLMRLYAKCYQAIGLIIALLGLCVVPFLNFIIGDVSYVKENITLLYLLFLLNSVISYFFVYKKALIIANQKNYIVEVYQQVFYAIQVFFQLIFLITTRQFIPYLLITIICTLLNNIYVARQANKMYPYLKDKDIKKLDKEDVGQIVANIKALVVYKFGAIILESTDSIFISAFINVLTVGLYANYKMLIGIFRMIGARAMDSIIASVGNLNAVSSQDRKHDVFKEIFYMNTWFYGFTATGLCIFLTPFVDLWLGADSIISFNAVLAACFYYYIANMHYPCYTYRTTAGLFVFGKFTPMIAATLNILFNIILGISFGLAGILWASTIARTLSYEIIDPVIIYKRVFKRNSFSYFVMYVLYLTLAILSGFIGYLVIGLISTPGIGGMIFKVAVFTIIYNFIFILTTFKVKEFKAIASRLGNIYKKRKIRY